MNRHWLPARLLPLSELDKLYIVSIECKIGRLVNSINNLDLADSSKEALFMEVVPERWLEESLNFTRMKNKEGT